MIPKKLLVLFVLIQACKVHKLKKNEVTLGPSESKTQIDTVQIQVKPEIKAPKVYFNTEQISFEKLKIKSKIEIKSTNFNQNIPATIHVRKDSTLWISVAMGLEAARCSISPDSMYILDRLNRNYYQVGFDEITKQLHFPMSFEMLQSLLVGNMPIQLLDEDVFYKNTDYNSIKQIRNSIEIINKFDLNHKKLYAISAIDSKTNVQLNVDYKSFTVADNIVVPKNITINIINPIKEKNLTIDIEHSKFDFLDRNIRFPYSVPKGYKLDTFLKF